MRAMSSASAGLRSWASVGDLFARRRGPGLALDRRHMNELHQRPGAARLFQGPPVKVVAQIVAGIARQPRLRPRGAGKAREWRIAGECRRSAKFYDAVARPVPAGIGKQQRDGVARARLDAKVSPSAGDAEHQHDIGFLCEQFWQIAIDRRVSGREYMRRTFDTSQSRPPPARQRTSPAPRSD